MNLIDALDANGVEYREHQSKDNEIFICCPFCVENGTSPDTRFRLGINVVTGWMKCFNGGCEKASRDPDYTWRELARVLDTGKLEATDKLRKKRQREIGPISLPDDFDVLIPKPKEFWGRKAYEYMKTRGVPDWQIKEMGIGYSLMGPLRYRIVFPVERGGELSGLVARTFVEDMEPKYLNSLGEKSLYGLPDDPTSWEALLVEGAFDYLSVSRASRTIDGCNFDCAATLSTALTTKQVRQLGKYRTVTIWFDPDEAGLKSTIKAARHLEGEGKKVYVVPALINGIMETRDSAQMKSKEILLKWKQRIRYSEALGDQLKSWQAYLEE